MTVVQPARPVLSTYRVQMRGQSAGEAFTFADAEKILDYLESLGVSHLYLSPILTATTGSEHGYDVTDPATVSAELGGPDGLAGLAEAAAARGIGIVVDIVPNHVGIADPGQNPWWWDVLRRGRASRYAEFFDIDWDADPRGRIILPVLGSAEDTERLILDGDVLLYGDTAFPVAPGTAAPGASACEVHDRQHYRLTDWRTGACGYRRFFSVSSLAALRQEDPAVFAATHREVARWFAEGLVDGVRIDHPDGLSDPCTYLRRLRDLLGERAWIVIEKILEPGEPLDPSLPVQGTTGYDVLREVGGVFVDPSGAPALDALTEACGFARADAQTAVRDLKAATARDTFAPELRRLVRAAGRATGQHHPGLSDATAAVLAEVGVYRCDYPALAPVLSAALGRTIAGRPDLAAPLAVLVAAIAADDEVAARFQQLCGAVTAKAVEDCYFYRDPRLVSLNEVGGDPRFFGVSTAEFHRSAAVRARLWPQTMTTLTTHDTKRGEDVRARIGVLSQVPRLWTELVGRWETITPSPDSLTGLFLWQNMFGVWPTTGSSTPLLRQRLHRYAEKAIREAGRCTSWTEPDPEFETAVHHWLDAVLDGPVAAELGGLAAQLEPHARSDALGQKLLALTSPGVPDVYQGTELWDDSLVDPDNRRAVDYDQRRSALHRHPKMRVIQAALHARRERPRSFDSGGYLPHNAGGPAAEHLVAFQRGADVLVAVTRWTLKLAETGWRDTTISVPAGRWVDRISGTRHSGTRHSGTVSAAELFAELPVALLERTGD